MFSPRLMYHGQQMAGLRSKIWNFCALTSMSKKIGTDSVESLLFSLFFCLLCVDCYACRRVHVFRVVWWRWWLLIGLIGVVAVRSETSVGYMCALDLPATPKHTADISLRRMSALPFFTLFLLKFPLSRSSLLPSPSHAARRNGYKPCH